MSGIAIITEACIEVKDRACVDVCPVQCIYEYDPSNNILFSEVQAGAGVENTHQPNPDLIAVSWRQHAVRQPRRVHSLHGVLPAGRVPRRSDLSRGTGARRQLADPLNASDPNTGHDHSFFIQHSRDVFAD